MEQDRTGQGKVWLAGAGPGDEGLLTLRAARLMKSVDVIVCDALISAEILAKIPDGTEVIDVGKRAGNHPVPQHEINKILVCEAKKGRKVLRLKGGDPFIFGRGGEEIQELIKEGIPYEVVPGVSSSSAVPAFAGIPVTHRDCASSFHVVTGHAKQNSEPQTDYISLVNGGGTLVFLMGVASMHEILEGLEKAGMNLDTPAALISNGTTAAQKCVQATVGTLEEEAVKQKVGRPGVIVVGDVCSLAGQFRWAEKRVLGGRQFLVTRPAKRNSELTDRLRELGAQVIEMPSIRTEPVEDNTALEELIRTFGTHTEEEWLLFTSPYGVETFFEMLRKEKVDIREFFGRRAVIRIGAIGAGTASALEGHGIFPDVIPEIYCAAELGKAVAEEASPGSRITAVRAEQASEELFPPMKKAGFETEDIPLYRTLYEVKSFLRDKISALLDTDRIDAVTFTSRSTVEGFVRAMGDRDLTGIRAVCIGEQTAQAAGEYGMEVSISDRADMGAMIRKITELFGNGTEETEKD